jgi:hypothetical protein
MGMRLREHVAEAAHLVRDLTSRVPIDRLQLRIVNE